MDPRYGVVRKDPYPACVRCGSLKDLGWVQSPRKIIGWMCRKCYIPRRKALQNGHGYSWTNKKG